MPFQVKIPEVGESISEVAVSRWIKKDGDYVEVDDIICEIESDKAALELPAEKAGTLKTKVKEGESIGIGDVIAEIDEAGKKPSRPAKEKSTEEEKKVELKESGQSVQQKPKRISPVAAKILHEAGVLSENVTGTGQSGRITKQDAMAAANQSVTADTVSGDGRDTGSDGQPAMKTSSSFRSRSTEKQKLSALRRTIARRLVAAKNETAMLTTFNEVDLSEVKAVRSKYKEIFQEKYDIGLGFMSFFTRAVCIALREWPVVNGILDGEDIEYHDYCDIGIAVSTPRGLVVPVVRNAESLSLAEIEREIADLAARARNNKLSIEEMSGGTFTITNGGVFGSLMSTPILNSPQSAILGMHKIMDRPVAINGEIVIRPMMYLALSYDHRIIDGRESVSFLIRIRELLEDPHRLLLQI